MQAPLLYSLSFSPSVSLSQRHNVLCSQWRHIVNLNDMSVSHVPEAVCARVCVCEGHGSEVKAPAGLSLTPPPLKCTGVTSGWLMQWICCYKCAEIRGVEEISVMIQTENITFGTETFFPHSSAGTNIRKLSASKYQKSVHHKLHLLLPLCPSTLMYPFGLSLLHSFLISSLLLALRLNPVYSFDPTALLFKNAWTINKDALSFSLTPHSPVHLLMFVQSSFRLLEEMEILCSDPAVTEVTKWDPLCQHLKIVDHKLGRYWELHFPWGIGTNVFKGSGWPPWPLRMVLLQVFEAGSVWVTDHMWGI